MIRHRLTRPFLAIASPIASRMWRRSVSDQATAYSHSIVAGGLPEMS